MQVEDKLSTSQGSVQGKRLYTCSPKLIKGMNQEDAQQFDSSYKRAKKVLNKLNEYAKNQYLSILKQEEDIATLNIPNYSEYLAAQQAARRVWKELQELTRT